MRIYKASGKVRGECAHQHTTYEEANACASDDHRACAALPGNCYSDRGVTWYDDPPLPRPALDVEIQDAQMAAVHALGPEASMRALRRAADEAGDVVRERHGIVSDRQIKKLLADAQRAGDKPLAASANRALQGAPSDYRECARVIRAAQTTAVAS